MNIYVKHQVNYKYSKFLSGKEVRSMLIDAFNIWTKLDEEKLETVKKITQKLHNSSLLIDDIEDNSKLRRGKPCAHLVYGTALTINSGNYMYFEALEDVLELNSNKAIKVFTKEMKNLHIGQGLDIYWRDDTICPTEDEYLSMV
jgi:geranylgeranyl diphosphate synthase, type III